MGGSGTRGACCQQQGCAMGSKCQPWGAQGTEPAWRAQRGFPLHKHPLAMDPPHASVSPPVDRVVISVLGYVGGEGKAGSCREGSAPREGGEAGLRGLEEVSVCSREGCACGMARERAQFSLAGAQRVFLSRPVPSQWAGGDGDCAGRWRWSHSPDNTIPKALHLPGTPPHHGGCSTTRTPVPVSAKAVTCAPGLCASPGLHPAGLRTWPEPGSSMPPARGLAMPDHRQHHWHWAPAEHCLPSPRPCREGEDLQAVRAGARGQQGSESPFRRGHCPLLSI